LNGEWQFAIDENARWALPSEPVWDQTILVPYAAETAASGIGHTGFYRACWYRRTIAPPPLQPGERWILHFGAVDYAASVWVNDCLVAQHEGGYTPFHLDLTPYLADGQADIVVRAYDDPHDLTQPRGKQDWRLEPHGIWYPRTTGIWQTVWLEKLPPTWIEALRWTPNVERWELGVYAAIQGSSPPDARLHVRLMLGGETIVDDSYWMRNGEVYRAIALPDPGTGEGRGALMWSPEHPNLIYAELSLETQDGVFDHVTSYAAMRSIGTDTGHILLNGHPYPLRLVLDQGYWDGTGLTPPSDDALRRDVELVKAMGFNGVRKHQKIEDPRYLYWADVLGLVVWEEMPTVHHFTPAAIKRFTTEWMDVIARDYSHPSVVTWVPFNESWGLPNLEQVEPQRHHARSVYHLTKALDPTRLVVGNDGWEHVETDIVGIHDYAQEPATLSQRYGTITSLDGARTAGRRIAFELNGSRRPIMLTEFGGIAFSTTPATWGYSKLEDSVSFERVFSELCSAVVTSGALAGFCYTQFADTYQEANGLLRSDRTPKLPLPDIHRITRPHHR
jgi:beta-galactosidase/beta-glucuronidase